MGLEGLAAHSDLTGDGGGGFALAHPPQQQDGLRWPQVFPCKHSPTVQVVDATAAAAIDGQATSPGGAEGACLLHASATVGTAQAILVEVLQQPSRAQVIVE